MKDPKQLVEAKISAELFNTKEKRQKAAMDLRSLLAHPGWIILEKILKYNAEANATVILDGDNITKEQETELRKDRLMFLFLKMLPVSLSEELLLPEKQAEPNDDPYEPNLDPTIDKQ